jgi:hypothetical protein
MEFGNLDRLEIGGGLMAGFLAHCFLFCATIGFTLRVIGRVVHAVSKLVDLRAAAVILAAQLVRCVHSTLRDHRHGLFRWLGSYSTHVSRSLARFVGNQRFAAD